MTRINTNVQSLIAQRVLTQNNNQLTKSLERLSTGVAVSRGADGPAQLIAGEKLRSEVESISAAIGNAERADQIANIAEGGLQEISNLLIEVQSLVGQSGNEAGLSPEEKRANQLQIDSIIQTIDRISSTTSFAGSKLLNGGFDFVVSGVDSRASNFKVNAAKITDDANVNVQVVVTASAQRGGLFLSTDGALDLTDNTSRFTFEIGGKDGSREFSFTSGTTSQAMVDSINGFTSVTGVSAATNGTGIMLKSTEFGSDQFVSFNIIDRGGQAGAVHQLSSTNESTISTTGSTAFSSVASPVRDAGQDVAALVNGVVAQGNGRTVAASTDALDVEIDLSTAGAQTTASFSALTITGGGARFNLGPTIDVGNQVRLGIKNVAARNIGATFDSNDSRKFLADLSSGRDANVVNGSLDLAQKIVNTAIDDVTSMRGRLGAFQKNVVQSTISSLSVAYENTSAAMSAIRDTDFAKETANLTRAQILVAASTNATQIANSRPQSVLGLLG